MNIMLKCFTSGQNRAPDTHEDPTIEEPDAPLISTTNGPQNGVPIAHQHQASVRPQNPETIAEQNSALGTNSDPTPEINAAQNIATYAQADSTDQATSPTTTTEITADQNRGPCVKMDPSGKSTVLPSTLDTTQEITQEITQENACSPKECNGSEYDPDALPRAFQYPRHHFGPRFLRKAVSRVRRGISRIINIRTELAWRRERQGPPAQLRTYAVRIPDRPYCDCGRFPCEHME